MQALFADAGANVSVHELTVPQTKIVVYFLDGQHPHGG
jgi:hypothetical protein